MFYPNFKKSSWFLFPFIRTKPDRNTLAIHFLSLFFLCCLFVLSSPTFAQEMTIIDAETQKGIENVQVYNIDQSISAITNSEGNVDLSAFTNPTDSLYFQHVSYEQAAWTLGQLASKDYRLLLYPTEELLEAFVFSAGKIQERLEEVTNKVDVINAKSVALTNPQTSADLLQQSGNVFVQKSQMGGGSPVIRGFEANKVLIVVDGVRLNNAIYRGGHLQNVITIDNSILDRTEVVFGPGSVIYGSDALGGVMHFITKKPPLSKEAGKLLFKGNGMLRYATVNNEKTTHVDFSLGGQKLGVLTSASYSDFGHLKIGKKRPHGYMDWGKRPFYISTENGFDSLTVNPDPNKLLYTGYQQFDLLQKWHYQVSNQWQLGLNLQYSTSSNIPRYDRLNDETDDGLKFAQWDYGPQKRFLGALTSRYFSNSLLFDNITLTASWQKIHEDRINRKFQETESKHREERVQVYGLNADFAKRSGANTFQYGLEATHNDVQSQAYERSILSDEPNDAIVQTRYPDGGSSMTTFALYLRHKINIGKKITLTEGIRFSTINLGANFIDTTFFSLPESSINDQFSAFTGSLGAVYRPSDLIRFKGNLSSGFRAPNIDDATKVFDPNDDIVVVPNLNLRPEYAWNAELGLTTGNSLFQFNADVYYNYLTNVIRRAPYSLNGLDSLIYDGELKATYANENSGKAVIYGFALGGKLFITEQLSIEKKFNYTKGRDISNDQPLGHIPPVFGQAKVLYQAANDQFSAALDVRYNGWKRIEDYSLTGEDKENEATPEGTPAWYTINAYVNWQLSKSIQLGLAAENILDHHYLPFSSGVSAPGRNFLVTLRTGF